MKMTRELALENLEYNQETGILTWKVARSGIAVGDVAGGLNHGYLQFRFYFKKYQAHRVIWLMMNGEWPDQIDHIDHNPSNNKLDNLRNVNHLGNSKNMSLFKNNSTGVCGVKFRKDIDKWSSNIGVNGKRLSLGSTDAFFDAVCWRKSAEIKYGYHINHGNG